MFAVNRKTNHLATAWYIRFVCEPSECFNKNVQNEKKPIYSSLFRCEQWWSKFSVCQIATNERTSERKNKQSKNLSLNVLITLWFCTFCQSRCVPRKRQKTKSNKIHRESERLSSRLLNLLFHSWIIERQLKRLACLLLLFYVVRQGKKTKPKISTFNFKYLVQCSYAHLYEKNHLYDRVSELYVSDFSWIPNVGLDTQTDQYIVEYDRADSLVNPIGILPMY